MIETFTTAIGLTPAEVEYEFDPGEPMVRYYRDGSGHPGVEPKVTILRVTLSKDNKAIDIVDYLSDTEIAGLESEAMQDVVARENAAAEARAEDRAERWQEEFA